ncbi:MAG: LysM domain-containing protein, partial [Novosphingobium sp.]
MDVQGSVRVDANPGSGNTLADQPARSALEQLMAEPSALDRIAPPPSYTVKPGDTLTAIATRFGSDVATLARINGIPNPDMIDVGQTIRLPESQTATHTVHAGETLSGIATAHGTDWQTLARINGISNPDLIRPGQELQLPGHAPVARPLSPAAAPAPAASPARSP